MTTSIVLVNMDTEGRRGGRGLGEISTSEHKGELYKTLHHRGELGVLR